MEDIPVQHGVVGPHGRSRSSVRDAVPLGRVGGLNDDVSLAKRNHRQLQWTKQIGRQPEEETHRVDRHILGVEVGRRGKGDLDIDGSSRRDRDERLIERDGRVASDEGDVSSDGVLGLL